MQDVKVYNLLSPRSGKPVANQFSIEVDDGSYFQSYGSVIAFSNEDGSVTLDEQYWDYSVTTLKYLKQWLGVKSKKEIKELIESGQYKLADLN